MLKNNTKITLRQAARHKTFSLINVAGLVIGLTVFLYVFQFVQFERSFDSYNRNAGRVYRINLYNTQNGVFDEITTGTVPGLAYSLKENLPGIEAIGRIGNKTNVVVTCKEKKQNDYEQLLHADPSILKILDFSFIDGDQREALTSPDVLIISESAALKYFGTPYASGKNLDIGFNNNSLLPKSYTIGAVFSDIPVNAHLRPDFILPPENEDTWNGNWDWSDVKTYVMLDSGTKPDDLSAGLTKIVKEHHSDAETDRYLLEPIRDIRLHAFDGSGRFSLILVFCTLGAIILALAWFNYVNLSIARFVERMKEVGVKKIIGASRFQLMFQFLTESFFYNAISFVLATLLFYITWPATASFTGLTTPVTMFSGWLNIITLFVAIALTTMCTGLYPAAYLSSFKPLQSLKGQVIGAVDRFMLRKMIVVAQLTISIFLITAVLAIQQQITFMQKQNLGIAIDQTLIVDGPMLTDGTSIEKYEPVRNEINRLAAVKGVTYASSFPGAEIDWHRMDIFLGEENAEPGYDSRIVAIGIEFLEVFGVELLVGRNFNKDIAADNRTLLINEEACRKFGFKRYEDALGKLVFIGSRKFEVIGVIRNYHFQTLQNGLQSMLFMQGYPRNPTLAVKMSTENARETIERIETQWKIAYPGNVFHFYFLDEFFDRQYANDRKVASLVSILAVIAVGISCLGLFGLSTYSVARRTREIGIRKVMGATTAAILSLLSTDFVKLLVLSIGIALPLCYIGITEWLERYTYKMPTAVWIFALPVLIVLMLTALTLGFQTLAAARKSPVKSMKEE